MNNRTNLSLNLNAIALLRNRRNLPWPDLLQIARIGLNAGAAGITVHPRPDQRHIRFCDVKIISDFLKTEFKQAIFNIEGYPSEDFLHLATQYADQITLVPDSPEQNTSDHGWDLMQDKQVLTEACKIINNNSNATISVFMEGNIQDLSFLKTINVDNIELYTGPYAACYDNLDNAKENLKALQITAQTAQQHNLGINAGHDLTVENIPMLIEAIPNIKEVSIGHSLTSDALVYGMETTIKRFLKALKG